MSETLKQEIRLEILTPKAVGGGLADLIQQLERVEAYVGRVNQKIAGGMKISPELSRSYDQIKKEIEAFASKNPVKGAYSAETLAKALGLDPGMLASRLDEIKKKLKDFRSQTREFTSVKGAVSGVHQALQAEIKDLHKSGAGGLGKLLTPTVAQVSGVAIKGNEVGAKVEGQIPLLIPAAQVQASVSGPINVNIPLGQVAGSAIGPTRGPDGRFLPFGPEGTSGVGGTVPSAKRKKAKGGPLDVPAQPGEFSRLRVETEDLVRETVTRADALGQAISETWDSVEQAIVKTVKRSTTGTAPLEQFRQRRKLEQETFYQLKAGLGKADLFALSQLQDKQASQIQALLTDDLKKALGPKRTEQMQKLLDAQAATLRAEAKASRDRDREAEERARQKRREEAIREQEKQVRFEEQDAARRVALERKRLETKHRASDAYRHGRGPFFDEMAAAEEARAARLETVLKRNPLIHPRSRARVQGGIEEAQLNAEMFRAMSNSPKPNNPVKPSGEYARFLSAMQAFTPMGMLANLTKVTGWAAAVTILYKSVELATYSMHKFLEITQETARLEQVFRGVGGSATQLTDDILKLADANGRSTEEAMESATEWARLGLNRAQVNEAVRVSLAAANVAQMHAGETTKQLSSLMHIYGLEVHQLNGVLGMLVNTSQNYNVTLEDLFTGLDRAAGVARQAGMSLAELQGIIGATVGKTGQSGIVVGNTIKSILVQFSNPTMQKLLRSYGVETLTKAGQEKNGSQILRDLFVRYQSLDNRERRNLTIAIAGRNQAARFVAMMDSYVQAQKLAIDSQLNLNSAQAANARIIGTVKGQLAGLRAEWDRLVVSAGNKIGPGLSESLRMLKNMLRVGIVAVRQDAGRDVPTDTQRNVIRSWLDNETKRTGQTPGFWRTTMRFNTGVAARTVQEEWLKFKAESLFERGSEEFQNQIQELHARASAHGMRARLFETIKQAYANSNRPEARQTMVELGASEMGASADAFKKAAESGDTPAVNRILDEQARRARQASLENVSAEMQTRTQRLAVGQGEAGHLRAEINELKRKGAAQDEIAQKQERLTEQERELAELRQQQNADLESLQAEATSTDQIIERKQEYLNLLKDQELLMQSIEQLSQQQSMDSAGARLDAQINSLDGQIEALERAHQALVERGGEDDRQTAEELRKQLAEHEARRAALDSPQVRAMADLQDNRRIAARRAAEEAPGVGYTEADKLLDEERQLQERLAGLRGKRGTFTDNEAVRAKEFEIQLWNTQERIQTRIVELARQERQIRLDAAREFNRGLLLAGPGELLQRLHVSQLARRNVSPGEFMAMSTENRRQYYDAMGGEPGAINRLEIARLRGHRMTTEQEQSAQARARSAVNDWDRLLNRNARNTLGALPATTPLPLDARARLVSENLGNLAHVVALTTASMGRLNQTVDTFIRRFSNQPQSGPGGRPQGPGLNISAGYSLGAHS